MKIAIFSGEIPSATFIEPLIEGVSKTHDVFLFGVVKRHKTYDSKHIHIYKTPISHWVNLGYTLYRLVALFGKRRADLTVLLKEVSRYKTRYEQWVWFSKFLPIILYRPDVFHMQWTRDLEFYAFLKTTFKIPMVVSLRGAHVNYTPIVAPYIADVYRDTFPKIDAFHAVSNAIAQEAQKYGDIKTKTVVIHSPIPNLFFDDFTLFRNQQQDVLNIVSVGRFHWKKGFRYALDALYLLKSKGFLFKYTIVGPKEMTEEVLFQINQLNLEAEIELIPHMNQSELKSFMKTQDVLLLPSVEEGIANVVLEAMALGIPVISTDCGGMSEVVMPNETGWLVPMRDAEAIAAAVLDVSEISEAELQRITQNAHDFVKRHFNAEDSIQQFLELYETVSSRL